MKRSTLKYLWILVIVFFITGSINAQTIDATGTFDVPITGDTLLYTTVSINDVNTNGVTDVVFTLSEPEISAWGDYSVAVRFTGSQIDVRDGGGFATPVNVVPVQVDTKYHIWLALDVANMTYTTWVKTDAMTKPVLIYQDAGFRNLVDTIYRWSALHNSGSEPDMLVVDTVKSVPENYAMDLPGGADGANSNVTIPTLNLASLPVTVEMWFKPDPTQNNYATLWYTRGASNNCGFQYDRWTDPTKVKAVWNGAAELPSDAPVPGEWNHMALVITSTSKTFYVNGVASTESGSSFAAFAFDTTTHIGWDSVVADRTLKGLVDGFRIWNTARTAQELEDNKYVVMNGNEAGLVGCWNFNDLATMATDLTANGKDATIHGATYIPSFDVTNATLSDLSLDVGSLTFNKYTTSYAVLVPYGTTTVNVSATATEYGTVVTGDGAIDVSSGSGTANVVVTALDGTTQMTYTVDITVDNPLDDAYLVDLDVSAGALDPIFHSDSLSYTVIVPLGTTSVDVTATASYAGATVEGDSTITISGGTGYVDVVVTSNDLSNSQTYSINFIEADGNNYAIYLPGSDGNYSNIDISGLGVDTLPYTIEMWIKPEGTQINNAGLIYHRSTGNAGIQYSSGWQGAGKLRFMTNIGGDYGTLTDVVITDAWHHVAAVLTDTTRTIYLDGRKYKQTIANTDYDFSDGKLYIGWDMGATDRAFKGVIDEVRVWNVYKDSATIADNKFDELNGDETGLVGYWNFNLKNTSQAVDLTSNRLHGVITGGTYVPSFDPTDATLAGISLSVGGLRPVFNSDTLIYNVVLPEGTDTVFVSAATTNPLASMVITDTVIIASGSGTATIDVTAFDGITVNNYVINFTTFDGSLTLMHSYTFEDGTAADVVGDADGVVEGGGTITDGIYTSAADGDYITLPGSELILNSYPAITMEAYISTYGSNANTYTMLAYFGGTSGANSYWIQPTRNDGSGLSRTEASGTTAKGTEFDANGAKYHVVSILTADSLYFYINGEQQEKVAANNLVLQISTANAWLGESGWADPSWIGSIYEFNIYEGVMSDSQIVANAESFLPGTDATLSALTADAGTFDPAFNPDTIAYDLSVPYGTASLSLTATTNDTNATVIGDSTISLSGIDTVDVVVTAEDGTTTKIYTVIITVLPASDDATLSALTVDAGALDPAFDPSVYTYADTVPHGTTSVTVTATPSDANANVSGDGAIDVSSGSGTATIVVTAEDGTTELTYTVNIVVETSSAVDDVDDSFVQIYPTVTSGSFVVKFSGVPGTITVYNMTGQIESQINATSQTETITLDKTGVYIVRVQSEGVNKIVKVTKVN